MGPLPGDEWGYTAILDRKNGGGFLTDHFGSAAKAIWYFEGMYAYSPHIPGDLLPIYEIVGLFLLVGTTVKTD